MTHKKITFKLVYPVFLALLAALVLAATMYVRSLLTDYEASQPQRQVEAVMEELRAAAADGSFSEKYALPEIVSGRFENPADLEKTYLSFYTDGELTFSDKGGLHEEDELFYYVKSNGIPLAEIKLKAAGPAVSKLVVFSLRDWVVESVTPVFEKQTYTVSIPAEFYIACNGVVLTAEDGTDNGSGILKYTLEDLYLKPELKITDSEGNFGVCTVKGSRVLVEYYDYDLTLPAALTVSCNGTVHEGEAVGEDRVRHSITLLSKPSVAISDQFGNSVYYEGGSQQLPLTYATVTAPGNYTVAVDGKEVPEAAVTSAPNPEFTYFTDYVKDLPSVRTYHIAVLKDNADITVTDPLGNPVALAADTTEHDLTGHLAALDAVPEEVRSAVDVLNVAKNWSLFMSADLAFSKISSSLISDSYQYQVAKKYSTGIDITFISNHILRNPAFTEESVRNFVWITEDCFSVDISFTKHMYLTRTGENVDDQLNDRFYFVRYDDTNDNKDNPTWKLASMKEIIE